MMKMMEDVRAKVSTPVFIWVNVMSAVMLASIAFVGQSTTALLVFLSAIASVGLAYVLWRRTGNIWVLGSVHIPLWTPLVAYVVFWQMPSLDIGSVYGVWLTAATLVMSISLVFDFRDTFQVLNGQKTAPGR